MKTVFNDKIITQSLCCWPQVLQRIINFKLTEHCFGYRDPFTQRCYRIHPMKMSNSLIANIHCVYQDDLPV